MTNGFVMKTHKTPKEEIQIAKDRRKDFILKIGQNLENGVYAFVLTLDFYNNSPDIDWSQSIADIDQKLYKKYNLTDEEIAYIEKTIKPMK